MTSNTNRFARPLTALLLLGTVGLAACSDPHNFQISKLTDEQKKELGQKLSSDEGQKLTGWMVRQAFTKQEIPTDVTVGQAIKEQDEWIAKNAAEEAQAAELKKRVEAERAQKQAEFAKIVSVVMISKKDKEQSYGRKFVAIEVAFENHSDKDILGIKGHLIITDIFGEKIKSINWGMDHGVEANGRYVETGSGVDINQFIDSDMKLWNTEEDKLRSHFEVATILFKDGTSIDAPT